MSWTGPEVQFASKCNAEARTQTDVLSKVVDTVVHMWFASSAGGREGYGLGFADRWPRAPDISSTTRCYTIFVYAYISLCYVSELATLYETCCNAWFVNGGLNPFGLDPPLWPPETLLIAARARSLPTSSFQRRISWRRPQAAHARARPHTRTGTHMRAHPHTHAWVKTYHNVVCAINCHPTCAHCRNPPLPGRHGNTCTQDLCASLHGWLL